MQIITSNSAERLFEELATELSTPLQDPLRPEAIVVPSLTLGRWLSHAFVRRWGICANTQMPFPDAFVRGLAALLPASVVPGAPLVPDEETLTWRIAEVLPGLLSEPGFEGASGYVMADRASEAERALRTVELAAKLASVLDTLLHHRSAWVAGWANLGESPQNDGGDTRMFAALYQACFGSGALLSPSAQRDALVNALVTGALPNHVLPERVSVFLMSSLAPSHLPVYAALARRVPVRFFLLTAGDPAAGSGAHPLAASLGQRTDALFSELMGLEGSTHQHLESPPLAPETLLGALQAALRGGAPSALETLTLAQAEQRVDPTLQVHSCHGRAREVEVLRDQLLDLFRRQQGSAAPLRAEDVLVLTPDLAAYTPHIERVFGAEGDGEVRIPFNVGSRRGRSASAAVNALNLLLEVLAGRFTAPDVLGLCQLAPIRHSAGLGHVDASVLYQWVQQAGIRWGVDAADRQHTGVPGTHENTFRAGLDRLFLGLAMDGREQRSFMGVAPVEGMEGNEQAALGAFADLCDKLFELRESARELRDVAGWVAWLSHALDALVLPGVAAKERAAMRSVLAGWARRAETAQSTTRFPLRAVRSVLDRLFEANVHSGAALSGGVTFDALGSLSGAPFRVVAMLGLGDDFPNAEQPLGFDPLRRSQQALDPSARALSRAAVLRSVLAARDTLILTYPGQSVQNNTALPPSVILAELLDALDDMFVLESGPEQRKGRETVPTSFHEVLATRHPLHPFDPRYFGADPTGRLFSYASRYVAASQSSRARHEGSPSFLAAPLPAPQLDEVDLEALIRALKDPTKTFVNKVLELYEPREEDPLPARERMDLGNGLERWQVMTDLIAQHETAGSADAAYGLLLAQGALPHGTPGQALFVERWRVAGEFAAMACTLRGDRQKPRPAEVSVVVDGVTVRVRGALSHLGRQGGDDTHGAVAYSTAGGGFELEMWVRHVFASLAGGPKETWLVQRVSQMPNHCTFAPLENPGEVMQGLLRVYAMSQRAPLPLFEKASRALAGALAGDQEGSGEETALDAARHAFETPGYGDAAPSEAEKWCNRIAWTGQDPFAPDTEAIPGVPESSAVRLAETVFAPLLAHRSEPQKAKKPKKPKTTQKGKKP